MKRKELAAGLAGLRALYEDAALRRDNKQVWAEAAVSYARVIQLLQNRNLRPEYANVDVGKVFRDVIRTVGESVRACTAVLYLTDAHFKSDRQKTQDEGFALVEKFLAAYRGEKRNTVSLHLLVEGYYINLRADYARSYEHLKAAYDLGITKDMLRRVTLFRLGRMCDVKLSRKEQARTHYRDYLRLFPNAQRTPVVRRYLKVLEQEEK